MAAKSFRLGFIVFLAISWIAAPLESKSRKINWSPGTVVDVGVYAKGAASTKSTSRRKKGETQYHRKDLWWEYSIRTGGQTYVGVLRSSPGRCGLQVNAQVKFFVSRERLYLLNPKGNRFELRILRKVTDDASDRQVSAAIADKHTPR